MRKLILFGVLIYVFLVARGFPADVATAWLVPEPVKLYGVEGTIWSGSAEAVDPGPSAAGITLGETRWTVSPLWLLTARASGNLSTRIDEKSFINASFSKPLIGSSLALKKLQGIVDLAILPANIRPNQAVGRVGLAFDKLKLDNLWPVEAEGSVSLVEINLTQPTNVTLGSFEIDFTNADDVVTGTVSDSASEISVDGVLSINPDRSYLFRGSALAGPNADQTVSRNLQFLGIPDDSGRVALTYEGTID